MLARQNGTNGNARFYHETTTTANTTTDIDEDDDLILSLSLEDDGDCEEEEEEVIRLISAWPILQLQELCYESRFLQRNQFLYFIKIP